MIKIPKKYKGKSLVASWSYFDADGKILGVVGRYEDKAGTKIYVPFFKDKDKYFSPGIFLNPRPLFGLEIISTHPLDKAVFAVEGEKSVVALQSLGLCAVTSLGGSQGAHKSDWTPLSGYDLVILIPDFDPPGEKYIQNVYLALHALETPPEVKIIPD